MSKLYNAQAAADKEAKRLTRIAFATGGTVPFTLGRLLDLKFSLKVIRAVHRNTTEKSKETA